MFGHFSIHHFINEEIDSSGIFSQVVKINKIDKTTFDKIREPLKVWREYENFC